MTVSADIERLRVAVEQAEKRCRERGEKATPSLLQARSVLLEHDYGDGAVEARKCQLTKTTRVLYRPGAQCLDPGWFVVCEDHGGCINTETRKRGRSLMSDPSWCYECSDPD